MHGEADDIRDLIENLSSRLERIERLLELPPPHERRAPAPPPQPPPALPTAPHAPAALSAPMARETAHHIPAAVTAPPSPATPESLPVREPATPPTVPPHSAASTARDAAATPHASTAPPQVKRTHLTWPPPVRGRDSDRELDRPREQPSLESIIGEKWLAWAGSLIVIIGVGFLAMYIDLGSLWGRLPPLVKCGLLTAFGAALLITGEVMYRRVGRAAAVGLYSAGLGTLYITSYAAFGWYALVHEVASLILFGMVSAGGFALTVRARSLTIGVLSVLGGYLAPLLLWNAAASPFATPVYLTAMTGLALLLSAYRARPYRPLRYVAMGCLQLVGLAWAVGAAGVGWGEVLVFGGIWWTMILAESILAAIRRQSHAGNAIATLLMTAWYATLTTWVLGRTSPSAAAWQGAFALALAVISAAAAMQIGPGVDLFRRVGRRASEILAASLMAQAAVLLVVAVALQFDGYGQSISWLALGVAAIETGRRLRSRAVDRFGLVVGSLALARIATLDLLAPPRLANEPLEFGPISITGWSLLALAGVAATVLAAHRALPEKTFRTDESSSHTNPGRARATVGGFPLPARLMTVAAFGWLALCLMQIQPLYATWGWLAAGAGLIAWRRHGEAQRYFTIGQLVLIAAAVKWLTLDTMGRNLALEGVDAEPLPLFNSQMMLAFALAACCWWFLRIQRARVCAEPQEIGHASPEKIDVGLVASPELVRSARIAAAWAPVAAAAIVLWGLTLEVHPLLQRLGMDDGSVTMWSREHLLPLGLTLLWGAGGFLLLLAGSRLQRPPLVVGGFILLLVAAVAWLTVDTLLLFTITGQSPPTAALVNPQFGLGILLAGMLAVAGALLAGERTRTEDHATDPDAEQDLHPTAQFLIAGAGTMRAIALTLIGLIGLWAGTIEITRLFPGQAGQTMLSVFWALYGITIIAIGFWKRAPAARYAGLALLGITLMKIAFIDTSQLEGIARALSFIAVGIVFVAASIGYARLSPRLLGEEDRLRAADPDEEPAS